MVQPIHFLRCPFPFGLGCWLSPAFSLSTKAPRLLVVAQVLMEGAPPNSFFMAPHTSLFCSYPPYLSTHA